MTTVHPNGDISHWMAGQPPAHGPAELEDGYDLVIVGGGLTGLWTAYHAIVRDPARRVLVLEAEQVGYGASGRNGGWLSPLVPGNRAVYARSPAGAQGVRDLQRHLVDTIDAVLDVLAVEGIDADQHRGGQLEVATTPAQLVRLTEERETHLRHGLEPDEVLRLDADETRARVAVDGASGSLLLPMTARVDPARLTRGLAAAVVRRGVTVSEATPALAVAPGRVTTGRGEVAAGAVAVCVEGATARLLGGRDVIPVNSSMIATERLPEATWERIGWAGRECLGDAAHTFVYAQRTADDRIAIGGRGSPYGFGSRQPGDGALDPGTVRALTTRLTTLFPGVDLPVAHAWRGALGVTRDWCAGVHVDASRRLAVTRGYAGHGVTATHLAARTVLDRLDGADTDLTRLPWNDHDSGRWEPEPLRWLGIHGMYRLFRLADRHETASGSSRTSLLARVGSRLAGLHE